MTRPGSRALAPLLALALLVPARGRPEEPGPPAAGATAEQDRAAPAAGAAAKEEGEPAAGKEPAPPRGSTPAPPPSPPPENPLADRTWVDASHGFIQRTLYAPVVRLDRFFADERDTETDRPSSFLRWRSEARVAEDASRPSFTTGVRATLRLPSLNRRLRRIRLVIAGETRDAVEALFPKEPGTSAPPAEDSTEEDALGDADAGVRFYLWDTLVSHADLGGGVLVALPPGVYGRLRFRFAFPVGPLFLSRVALVGFWRSDVKFGSTATLELDRPLRRALLLRLATSGTVSQGSNGLEWWSDLAAIVPLPPRSAAQIGFAVTGATDATAFAPDPGSGLARAWRVPPVARLRAYTRLRRDVYRRWLFVEIEPEIAWPWSPERGRYAAWGLALRLEVQFLGKEARPPPPPPPPPEPADPPAPADPPR